MAHEHRRVSERERNKTRRTAAGATKPQPVRSKTLLQNALEPATAGSQTLKQKMFEPMKLFDEFINEDAHESVWRKEKYALVPFDHLLVAVVVAVVAREAVRVHQSTEGVSALQRPKHQHTSQRRSARIFIYQNRTYLIITVGVKLASIIVRGDVHVLLLDVARDEEVRGRLEELHARECASGNRARAVAGLGAPCDGLGLFVGDGAVGVGGAPEAEVCIRLTSSWDATRGIQGKMSDRVTSKADEEEKGTHHRCC